MLKGDRYKFPATRKKKVSPTVTMTTLDSLIQEVGSCGPFQTMLVVAVRATEICSVWGMLFMAFGGLDPGWTCLDGDGGAANLSSAVELAGGVAGRGAADLRYASGTNWTKQSSPNPTTEIPNNLLGNHSTDPADQCQVFKTCHNVSFLPGSSTVVSEWGLVCGDKWVPSLIYTIQVVGILVGSYVAGHLGDCLGRRICLYGMAALHAIANLAAAFSPSWHAFAALRFFIGVAAGGMLTTIPVLPTEYLGQFWRGVAGAVPVWNVGAALFSVAVLLLRDWKQIHLLTAAVSAVIFLFVFWVPESLRWLAVHNKDDQAAAIAERIARINKRPAPSSDILTRVAEAERKTARSRNGGRYSYMDLLIRGGSRLRKDAVFMGLIWVNMAFVYYGISFGVKELSGDFYINFLIFAVAEVPGMVFIAPALSILGRRWGCAAHFIVAALACFAVLPITLLLGEDEEYLKGKLVMSMALLGKIAVVGAWFATSVFGGELYPTVVRNLAYGFVNAAARIGGMLGPVLFPDDPELLHVILTAMGGLMLMNVVLVLSLPETKGRVLEDTLSQVEAVALSPLPSSKDEALVMCDPSDDTGKDMENVCSDGRYKSSKDAHVRSVGRSVLVDPPQERLGRVQADGES